MENGVAHPPFKVIPAKAHWRQGNRRTVKKCSKRPPFVILRTPDLIRGTKDLSFIETVLLPQTARFRQILHCVQDDMFRVLRFEKRRFRMKKRVFFISLTPMCEGRDPSNAKRIPPSLEIWMGLLRQSGFALVSAFAGMTLF